MKNRLLRILTWHIHGSYLYYLTQANCEFYIPFTTRGDSGYQGLPDGFTWGKNVKAIPAEEVRKYEFDCILFQSNYQLSNPTYNYLQAQIEILSKEQVKSTPKIFVEHDPPRSHPTDTRHILFNTSIPIVHVTKFNQLMWDCGITPTTVIEHGVTIPHEIVSTGQLSKGLVVINNIQKRGRRLGFDIFQKIRKHIPLDIAGIGTEEIGGLGPISMEQLFRLMSKYRFFFHPARYTSLGLAVIEAMMIGLPIIGFATTELPTIITNGEQGYIDTDSEKLTHAMEYLLGDRNHAKQLGISARKVAQQRFSIQRFSQDWQNLFQHMVEKNERYQFT